MMERVLELFAQGWVVMIGSYYGESPAEDAEEIQECFEECEEGEWLSLDVEIIEAEHRVELFVQDDE